MARLALAAVAFAVTAAVTPLMTIVARRTGIVDRPGALKVHEQAVPYLGGVAVFAGLAVSGRAAVLVPCALALALGVWDDARGVAPLARFLLEIPVGVAVAVAVPTRLPGPLGPALVVVATVALINAVNMLDGIDALAAGVGLAAAAGFAFLHLRPAAALAGALAGFLLWNRPPARIYLGDGGAYLLGTALAALLALTWRAGVPLHRGVAACLLVGVPALELVTTVVRRLRHRTKLSAGDRGHSYDRLRDRGWSVARTSLTLTAAQATLAALAVLVGRG